MTKLKLSGNSNKEVLLDSKDLEGISNFKWYYNTSNGYISRSIYCQKEKKIVKSQLLHRQILGNPDCLIDHINGNKLDNRRSNLRLCNYIINGQNRSSNKNSKSKYKGVSFDKKTNKWKCSIFVNKKYVWLGRFQDEIEAAKTYNRAALKYFGEFAKLNEIENGE